MTLFNLLHSSYKFIWRPAAFAFLRLVAIKISMMGPFKGSIIKSGYGFLLFLRIFKKGTNSLTDQPSNQMFE